MFWKMICVILFGALALANGNDPAGWFFGILAVVSLFSTRRARERNAGMIAVMLFCVAAYMLWQAIAAIILHQRLFIA